MACPVRASHGNFAHQIADMDDAFQYDVFLSHSSKDTPIVLAVAERLRRDGLRVWFDGWEIKPGDSIPAKIDEGIEQSRILVLCMSANGLGSEWVQLETNTRRFNDPLNKARRFVPLRLDDTSIKGSLAQFLFINWQPAEREQEYPKLLEACRPPAKTPVAAPLPTEPSQPGMSPDKLPYLCNRSAQEEELIALLEQVRGQPGAFQRPIVCVVHGAEGEAHSEFLERLEKRFLPHCLKRLGLAGRVEFLTLKECPETHDAQAFGKQLRRLVADELQLTVCDDDSHLLEGFKRRRAVIVAPTLHLTHRAAFTARRDCLNLVHDFWAAFPALPTDLFLIAFITIKHLPAEPPMKPGGWRSFFPFATKPPPPLDPREQIRAFIARTTKPNPPVICRALSELESIRFEHVNAWSLTNEVKHHFPRGISDEQLRAILGHQSQRPMQSVIDELQKLIDAQPPRYGKPH